MEKYFLSLHIFFEECRKLILIVRAGCFKFVIGKSVYYIYIYAVIVIFFIVLGSTMKVDLVWDMSDMFNGLMVLPNLVALLACMGIVREITKEC